MFDKRTYWKDGNILVTRAGVKYIVHGKFARNIHDPRCFVEYDDYDDNLHLVDEHNHWKGKYDIIDVRGEMELFMDEWPGKPIKGKAWNQCDDFKYDVTIIGYCHNRWVCENSNGCLETFNHAERA